MALADERLCPRDRLRRRPEYLRCYRTGRRRHGALMVLHVAASLLGPGPRLGISVSRRVGKAVTRQRLKRRVREVFRRWPGRRELPPVELVVDLKAAAAGASFDELALELRTLLAGVAGSGSGTRRPAS